MGQLMRYNANARYSKIILKLSANIVGKSFSLTFRQERGTMYAVLCSIWITGHAGTILAPRMKLAVICIASSMSSSTISSMAMA